MATAVALSLAEARRVALAAQGFDAARPRRRVGVEQLRGAIRRLGLLQLDYVNVVVPSHYQVLFSRLGPYPRAHFATAVYRGGEFTEQWAHEASIIPVATWPLLRHRMEARRAAPFRHDYLAKHPEYVDAVLEEVRARGALVAGEVTPHEGAPRRIHASWYGTVQRAALEAHFARGLLAVVERRDNMTRVFDLVERVLPAEHHRRVVAREEAQRQLLRQAVRAHGVGTAADLADYHRMSVRDARPRLAELVDAGAIRVVRVEGWREPAFLDAEARPPRPIAAAALLSPFDPVVWYRPRLQRLFEFDHRFEIFVPAAKRRWGCYVLPFLLGDRLVARVDLKADRERSRLLVPAAYLERAAADDADAVAAALASELRTMSTWLGLEHVVVGRRGDFARALRAAVGAAAV